MTYLVSSGMLNLNSVNQSIMVERDRLQLCVVVVHI